MEKLNDPNERRLTFKELEEYIDGLPPAERLLAATFLLDGESEIENRPLPDKKDDSLEIDKGTISFNNTKES